MGNTYTKIGCKNKTNNCNLKTPIPVQEYIRGNKDKTGKKCVSKNGICNNLQGEAYTCCDQNDPNAQEILNDYNVHDIKINKNSDEIITEIDICNCTGSNSKKQKCKSKYCKNFKKPTRYEACKINQIGNQESFIDNSPIWRIT